MEKNNDEHHNDEQNSDEQNGDEQRDDEQQDDDEKKRIEEAILSIIRKIKKDRNRACVQNIHTFLNRRGINMELGQVGKLIDNLLERNIIVNREKRGNESFYVVDLLSDNEEISDEISDVKNDSEHASSSNAIQEFIDDKFYAILINKIKLEVKLALTDAIKHECIQNIKHDNNNNNNNKDNNNRNEINIKDELISTLKDEINFLRNEIVSKDKVIEIMIKDKFDDRTEKSINFVRKSSVTNVESKVNTGNITNDKNDKKSVNIGSKKKRSVVILGDSLVKDVEQHKLRNSLNKERIFIKNFSGATVEDMKTYIIPSKNTTTIW